MSTLTKTALLVLVVIVIVFPFVIGPEETVLYIQALVDSLSEIFGYSVPEATNG